MSSVFTTSPIGTSLELSASTRQTGVSSGEIAVRKFPNIQENFLDAPAQKDLETRLEEFIAKTGALQSKVIFYNQRFQKQDPKLVKNWEGEYLEHLEKDEETFKEYTYSVQGLTKDMDQRTHLLQQRIQDMQFLQTLFHQEWEGNTSSFSLGFSLIPTWQTRYGVSYRMSQVKSYVEARKKETTLQKEISRSGETPILSPATLVSGKDKESGELNYERVFAKLQDLIMRAVVLKEYIFVYDKPDNGELTIPCSFEGDVKAVLLDGEKTVNMSQDKKSKCIIVSLAYKGIYIFIFLIDGSYILIFCSRIRFKSKVFLCSDLTFYRIIFRQKIIRGGILQRRISYF